ncbi:MAG: hypothetical protein CVU05_15095 [Bacteroidetes bacterium HGW-Bacteroidetes-21]|nr:MAG: hypothetical protein CVU05_15095 [Bacteroidetes bacterium HGW-Bacteroidetes-21]
MISFYKKSKQFLKSDSVIHNKEGWLIDDINFNGFQVFGNIKNPQNTTHCIYPNPANNFIKIDIDNSEKESIIFKLFDKTGKLILVKDLLHSKEIEINISNLEEGSYEYVLYSKEKMETGNLIIRR